jgi:hypothetical protein
MGDENKIVNFKLAQAMERASGAAIAMMQAAVGVIEAADGVHEIIGATHATYEVLYVVGQLGEEILDGLIESLSVEQREIVRAQLRSHAKPLIEALRQAQREGSDGTAG